MNTRYLGLTTGSQNVAEVAEGVDFDGTTDYLSRATDLTGNVDSKTFTFSCWVYAPQLAADGNCIISQDGFNGFFIYASGAVLNINAKNSSNVTILSYQIPSTEIPPNNTWFNILISVDLTNTLNKSLYINDKLYTSGWGTYTNDFIDFTRTLISVGRFANTTGYELKGRLSHLFLDYTYRDLSIEANRRLFITADGKPTPVATLKALNPILYLPMKDASTAHINEGTGGNFVQNGTLDTASRGANQDNCVASKSNGKYLSKNSQLNSFSGTTKTITLSFNLHSLNTNTTVYHIFDSYGSYIEIYIYVSTSGSPITFTAKNSSGTTIFQWDLGYGVMYPGTNTSIQISFDLSNTSKRHAFVNGVERGAWQYYVNDYIYLNPSTSPKYTVLGAHAGASNLIGSCGEFYFDTKYIDLASNNPFWDSETNKPVPVRKAMATLGSTPLICMPISAGNPTKNYGTGGDFTLNGGGLVGARGASEFWARSINTNNNYSNYLGRNLTYSYADFSLIIHFKTGSQVSSSEYIVEGGGEAFTMSIANDALYIKLNSGGTIYTGSVLTINTSYIIEFSKQRYGDIRLYINNVSTAYTLSGNNSGITSSSNEPQYISRRKDTTSYYFSGSNIAIYYFVGQYIDFSQEVNRNKFVDGLGYPKDLKAQIDAGVIPKPLIYLPFDDTTNLGKNLGTGGDFTVNGTVTAGADVLG